MAHTDFNFLQQYCTGGVVLQNGKIAYTGALTPAAAGIRQTSRTPQTMMQLTTTLKKKEFQHQRLTRITKASTQTSGDR